MSRNGSPWVGDGFFDFLGYAVILFVAAGVGYLLAPALGTGLALLVTIAIVLVVLALMRWLL